MFSELDKLKNIILSSSLVRDRCQNFKIFEDRFLNKDFENFIISTEDEIVFDYVIKKDYITYDNKDFTYFDYMKSSFDRIKWEDLEQNINLTSSLSDNLKYKIVITIQSLIKFDSLNEKFKLLQQTANLRFVNKSQINDNQKIFTIRKDLETLESKIKNDLYELLKITGLGGYSGKGLKDELLENLKIISDLIKDNFLLNIEVENLDSKDRQKIGNEIVSKWLDAYSDPEIRKFITYNKYNYYFSLTDEWLDSPLESLLND